MTNASSRGHESDWPVARHARGGGGRSGDSLVASLCVVSLLQAPQEKREQRAAPRLSSTRVFASEGVDIASPSAHLQGRVA